MHHSVKLTDAIWLLQLVIFPSHSCFGWPESSPHRDLNPRLRGGQLTNLAIPPLYTVLLVTGRPHFIFQWSEGTLFVNNGMNLKTKRDQIKYSIIIPNTINMVSVVMKSVNTDCQEVDIGMTHNRKYDR